MGYTLSKNGLDGENLSELGLASNPTILATLELDSVA
jgi:hypothetical protein